MARNDDRVRNFLTALGLAWSACAPLFAQQAAVQQPPLIDPAIRVDVDAGCEESVVLIGSSPSVSISLSNPRAAEKYEQFLESDHAARDEAARSGAKFVAKPFSVAESEVVRLPAGEGGWASHLRLSLVANSPDGSASAGRVWISSAAFDASIRSIATQYPTEVVVREVPVFIVVHLDPELLKDVGDGEYLFEVDYDTRELGDGGCWAGLVSAHSAPFVIRKAQSAQDVACLEENLSAYSLSHNRFKEAEEHARRLVEVAPGRDGWMGYYYLGNALEAQNRMAEAVEAWKVFVDKYPADTESRTVMKLRNRLKAFEASQSKAPEDKPK